MQIRLIILILFSLILSGSAISSGAVYDHNNLNAEENTALNQLDTVFGNNQDEAILYRDNPDEDIMQDATMIVMDIRKRWNEWSPEFRKISGKYFLSKSEASFNQLSSRTLMRSAKAVREGHKLPNWVETAHFNIEWGNNIGDIDSGLHSDNILSCSNMFYDGATCKGIPDIVDKWADYFEEVWTIETELLGFIKPFGTEMFLYDVYIANSKDNISGNDDDSTPTLSYNYLGMTITYCDNDRFNICKDDNTPEAYSYIVVNRSYSNEDVMKITATHEFFHAIQFSYPSIDLWWFTPDSNWWIEATATWMEEMVYDEVNHYYPRVWYWLNNPELSLKNSGTSYSGHEYGDVIFIIYVTDVYLQNRDFVRDVWESEKSGIDAFDTVLGMDKYNNRDFESLFKGFVALNAVADIGKESGGYEEGKQYGRANVTRKHLAYPAASSVSGNEAPHELGSNYIRFIPPDNNDNRLAVEFNGADNINWLAMIVKVRSDGMGYEREDVIVDPLLKSGCNSIDGFGSVYNEVFLVSSVFLEPNLADTSPYNYKATVGGDCPETPIQAYSVSEDQGVTDVNNDKTDKRCFIATVAFGSPDSPFVEILRDFRDRYLITNSLGRRFVSIYYSVSPSIADFLEQHQPAPVIVRYALIPVTGIAYLLLNSTFHGKVVIALFLLTVLGLSAYKSLIKRQ